MASFTDSHNNILSEVDAPTQLRADHVTKVNVRTYRKESVGMPASMVRQTYGQLSQKKLPSVYNNSATLETMEHESAIGSKGVVQQLRLKIAGLEKEIQVLHTSYNARLQELTNQHNEKSQKYLTLIHDMHTRHQQEVEYYCGVIAGFEEERGQIAAIEEKMNFINAGIEDILRESAENAQRNQQLAKEIEEKDELIQEREQLLELKEGLLRQNSELLEAIDQELSICRQKIIEYEQAKEQFQRVKDSWKEFQSEIVQLIDNSCSQIDQDNQSECHIGQTSRSRCQHCKIQSLGRKVNQTMARLT